MTALQQLRGGGDGLSSTNVTVMIAIAAGYAVQLMLVPKLLHEQHFESSPTAMETFWMRGAAVPMTALEHC
jgi:hypothetical protein